MQPSSDIDPEPYAPAMYGDAVARVYDDFHAKVEPGLIDRLIELARGGSVLDLGIGTGRVAIPLRRAGLAVHGVESSPAMLQVLQRKPHAAGIALRLGDFCHDDLGAGPFRLVFSLLSTLHLLPELHLQQACLANVARHLAPDGWFVSEAWIDEDAFPAACVRDVVLQTASGPVDYRTTQLVPPLPQLDAMAAGAGLRLQQRWRDWRRTPYQPGDARHVSIYEKAPA